MRLKLLSAPLPHKWEEAGDRSTRQMETIAVRTKRFTEHLCFTGPTELH